VSSFERERDLRRDSSLTTQCAVPGACFEALREFLGNTIECFASPLNCRFERYFSAFPGLERSFGSLGSFFDEWSRIEAGSFEVNPPFVPEVLGFAAAKIGELLGDGAKGPLSFLAVVPDWVVGGASAPRIAVPPRQRHDPGRRSCICEWRPAPRPGPP
jgi:hypothetical protein